MAFCGVETGSMNPNEHATVAAHREVLLVRDEVGQLLGVAGDDVDRLRQLERLGADGFDLHVPQHEVVAGTVDGAAGLHFDGEIAAAADDHLAGVPGDDAGAVQALVVPAVLVAPIGFVVDPVGVVGDEPFEEIESLEAGLASLGAPVGRGHAAILSRDKLPRRRPGGEMVDAGDLKSSGSKGPCRFESGPGHCRG